MEQSVLNLTRKWRSKKFKEIVGQDLVVKILQNSLYKKSFFPVYLFSGQRGCGKTSTARVFATAVNCSQLEKFQTNPRDFQIPCLECDSCMAMKQMRHPDFVEIDAASYTGVDNIRNIIDTSSFLPVLSHKKIYLIDEVHMLSKAAFNAFLKILEEPPKFVIFILATTEMQKVPETVKSRCFQLFFNSVPTIHVMQHLQTICEQEKIAYQDSALELIAQVCDGSLRDAINLLEQARFAGDCVSREVVCSVLGYVDDQYIYDIVCAILEKKDEDLIRCINYLHQHSVSIDYVIKRLQEFVYDAIMMQYNVSQKYFLHVPDAVKAVITARDGVDLMHLFQELSLLDELLAKTGKKQLVLEAKLLSMMIGHSQENVQKKKYINQKNDCNDIDQHSHLWQQFLQVVPTVIDPILYAMLRESKFVSFDELKGIVHIKVLKKFMLFQDLFEEQKSRYQSLLDRCFHKRVMLIIDFCHIQEEKKAVVTAEVKEIIKPVATGLLKKTVPGKLDISDKEKWELTHTLLKCFGGTVSQVGKDTHEPDA